MKVTVNDDAVDIGDGTTVADLLVTLGLPDKGIAVAVDWAVIPRSEWHLALSDGAKIDVVAAVQGG